MNFFCLYTSLSVVLVLWFCMPYLLKRWQISSLRRLCKKSRVIVLTYDDGPGKILTPDLLSALASNDIHANFFMVGRKFESYSSKVPDIVSKVLSIGSHSFSHFHV